MFTTSIPRQEMRSEGTPALLESGMEAVRILRLLVDRNRDGHRQTGRQNKTFFARLKGIVASPSCRAGFSPASDDGQSKECDNAWGPFRNRQAGSSQISGLAGSALRMMAEPAYNATESRHVPKRAEPTARSRRDSSQMKDQGSWSNVTIFFPASLR